jgi:hypothetical protein
MAYRTFDRIEPLDAPIQADDFRIDEEGFAFWRGIVNSIIPSLIGWVLIWGMGYVAWCLLP